MASRLGANHALFVSKSSLADAAIRIKFGTGMKNKIKFKPFLFILPLALLLLSATFAPARQFVYIGAIPEAAVEIQYGSISIPVTTAFNQMAVDPTTLTLSFPLVQYQTAAYTNTFTQNITTGFGQSNTYTISLSFAPSAFSFSVPATSLTPGSAGVYNLGALDIQPVQTIAPLTFTGTYSVQGPTTTVTGTFDVPAVTSGVASEFWYPATLNTAGYPGQLTVSQTSFFRGYEAAFNWAQGQNLVDTNVDGGEVIVPLGGVLMMSGASDYEVLPTLAISLSGSTATISWATNTSSFQLFSTPSLTPPVHWTAMTNQPAISGTSWVVTVQTTNSPQFFELELP
jgi:hypothetical protein